MECKMEGFLLTVLVICLTAMCAVGVQAMARVCRGKQAGAQSRKVPVYCVETVEKRIALSFDVATGTQDLQELMDIMEKHQVHATFFVVGSWVRRWPQELAEIAERGHELASHADHHVDMTTIGRQECVQEITALDEEVRRLTGYSMSLFRAPYGAYNNQVIEAAESCGYLTVQWSVDSLDWKEYGAQDMLKRVLEHKNLKPGAILLFHNNTKYTAQALDGILVGLEEMGYSIGTVSELVLRDNYGIDAEGRQYTLT